ncbi:putative malate:quinone oxidoreductase [Nocardioides baekrokdamisoli]|uniref:Probable malate:quinone oxidoreductase n=1 Tax=Nocardioides baekrokdamisoli TaxID=1804624 RepID=A0A3G9IFF1_9ACTN|nr:malate dehydrogenase (quinone) [Nocardioides baekrokdamisoli]BBH17770.1 putative malate:quinone oxidoreductase [Nocardioides baekrokdamisoli]
MDIDQHLDVVLVGGGIMSATLGVILQELEPTWSIKMLERLDALAEESSGPWNNAGTGHSALCELNYTPQNADGSVDISKAIVVNEQFQVTRQVWAYLVENGRIPDPAAFVRTTPHLSFVWGADNVAYLKARWEALSKHPLFSGMKFSDDPEVIRRWAPLLLEGRKPGEPIAATFTDAGTDVDFGALTNILADTMIAKGATVDYRAAVKDLHRTNDGLWHVMGKQDGKPFHYTADFVFVGAGGYALPLLQKAGIPEIKGFGGFPVSGEFLRTDKPEIVAQHQAKVYGKAAVGAPPMSVPHLDTRVVDGKSYLMFGPYAGWTPKFLKQGSFLDLFGSIKGHNLFPMAKTGTHNVPLTWYLITQVLSSSGRKFTDLLDLFPDAKESDWEKITAGQRVQVIRPNGDLQFGTEVITHSDGSIGGLLGASPGASTAAPIMLDLIKRCFPQRWEAWGSKIAELAPGYGRTDWTDETSTLEALARTAKALKIAEPQPLG